MDRKELAVEYKHNGNNCCQAVLLAFEDVLDVPRDTLRAIGVAFGSGMGNLEGTCGALCGSEMVLGLKKYEGKPLHRDAATMQRRFTELCGGVSLCKDLKGKDIGIVVCDCDNCIRNAVQVMEEML